MNNYLLNDQKLPCKSGNLRNALSSAFVGTALETLKDGRTVRERIMIDEGLSPRSPSTDEDKYCVEIASLDETVPWIVNLTLEHRHYVESVGIFNQESPYSG